MPPSKFFADLQARLDALFASSPAKDLERNIKTMLGNAFSRLDLATREELDIHVKLAARTRERLAALEARVTELEQRSGVATDSPAKT